MKKTELVFASLLTLGLTACANHNDNTYRGEVLLSNYNGENLELTIAQNDCKKLQDTTRLVKLSHKYDSNIIVGSCVEVTTKGKDIIIKNISRSRSGSFLSRTGKY